MTTIACVAGDTADTRTVTLAGANLATATSAEAHVWPLGTTATSAANVGATLAGDTAVSLQLGAWLAAATPNHYHLEIEVTFPGGTLTWPDRGTDTIIVRAGG